MRRTAGGLRTCRARQDRKSTRLNSSHLVISYAVFCLKKKNFLKNIICDVGFVMLAAIVYESAWQDTPGLVRGTAFGLSLLFKSVYSIRSTHFRRDTIE